MSCWSRPRPRVSGAASASSSTKSSNRRKTPAFDLFPIGKRVWDFVWEVLFQGKVIRERPLPGLAHAFVFWGFCAFALVTLNHFAIGLRTSASLIPLVDWPLLLLLCRSLRRSLRSGHSRPFCPPVSGSSQMARREALLGIRLHCLLIFVLMVTYLASFLVTDAGPAARFCGGCTPGVADLSVAHSAHQAPAPGAEPSYCFSVARRASRRFLRSSATRTSASSPA